MGRAEGTYLVHIAWGGCEWRIVLSGGGGGGGGEWMRDKIDEELEVHDVLFCDQINAWCEYWRATLSPES